MRRPCLGLPGYPCRAITSSSRCPHCQRQRRNRYRGAWPALARQAVARYRTAYGDTCPGYDRAPHPTTDWVVDHDLGPMCRQCNGRKAATVDTARALARNANR
jgi:hypothetical protein